MHKGRTRNNKVRGIQIAIGPRAGIRSPFYPKSKKARPRGRPPGPSAWDKRTQTELHGDGETTRTNAASKYLNSLLWRPGPEKTAPGVPETERRAA
jgi:hypothetical protein